LNIPFHITAGQIIVIIGAALGYSRAMALPFVKKHGVITTTAVAGVLTMKFVITNDV